MVQVHFRLVALLALALCALYGLARCYRPGSLLARWLERLLAGLALLLCWNALSPYPLGVNPLSMGIAGSLGLPGACLLLALKML